jgi:phosphatidylethanolamine/phosphatidyl-N-methylethanolamine N-methyltransferase
MEMSQHKTMTQQSLHKTMDEAEVRLAYKRWAPVYDYTFGLIASVGRKRSIEHINTRSGSVLEVGVGTGLSLPHFNKDLQITGIDLSPEMLAKARERAEELKLTNVKGIYEMDASALAFADNSFNTVVAMYLITVVPDPARVMRELERVCAPGGEVILVNHFSQDHGARGWVEHRMAPYADLLGWHPVFPVEKVMVCPSLKLVEKRGLFPVGLFSMLRFQKAA